jgi:hypothetical protein
MYLVNKLFKNAFCLHIEKDSIRVIIKLLNNFNSLEICFQAFKNVKETQLVCRVALARLCSGCVKPCCARLD